MRARIWSGGLLISLVLAGCSGPDTFFTQHRTLGKKSDAILTDAGARLVTATDVPPSDAVGHFTPTQINCAEPSPDVAKAIDTAFSAGISVNITGQGAQLPADVQAKIAGAVARARSEALVQMTERLPTIQLLRDGLFRACEAYANGALSPTSYALMLSRYGDTMVTMLNSDLIAGDFGRQLAAISGSASSASSSSLEDEGQAAQMSQRNLEGAAADVADKAEEANQAVEAVQQEKAAASASGQTLPTPLTGETAPTVNTVAEPNEPATPVEPADPDAINVGAADPATPAPAPQTAPAPAPPSTTETPAEANLKQKLDELEKASRSFKDKLASAAKASSAAKATAASGFAAQDIANERAAMLADMQRLYLQHPSPGALMVACITALDRASGQSPFSKICETMLPMTGMVIAKQVDAQLETQKEDSAIAFVKDGVGRSLKARAAVKPLDTPDQPVTESASTGKSVSDTVTEVQIVLQQLGLYKGKIDGLAGRGTTAAIRKFQQMNALPITGLLDDETQAKIIAAKKP